MAHNRKLFSCYVLQKMAVLKMSAEIDDKSSTQSSPSTQVLFLMNTLWKSS